MICTHLGPETPDVVTTDICCGDAAQVVHVCNVKGRCVKRGRSPEVATCDRCEVRNQPPTFPTLQPVAYREIGMPPKAKAEGHFNCSIHNDEKPGFVFAYRSKWTKSDVRVGRLTDAYRVSGSLIPTIALHERATVGREDPRLFRFRGQWHFSYTGFEKREFFCSVMYAKLGNWPFVTDIFYPRYAKRQHAEKNWVFFESGGELFAVYEIGPGIHRVLAIRGEEITGEYETRWNSPWAWGVMRGGASPQCVGDEFYSWFHGVTVRDSVRVYTLGLYTFEARPPFRPLRIIPTPLVVGGYSQWDDEIQGAKNIFYPCGAALKGGKWHISAGEHDNRCSVVAFDAYEVEGELKACN